MYSYYWWVLCIHRRVLRYQRGNQKPNIEEEQTTQWQKEKVQKDKQRSTKHTYKTKDRVTRTPLKTEGLTHVFRKGKQFLLHLFWGKYTDCCAVWASSIVEDCKKISILFCFCFCGLLSHGYLFQTSVFSRAHCGHDYMVVGFTSTCTISA